MFTETLTKMLKVPAYAHSHAHAGDIRTSLLSKSTLKTVDSLLNKNSAEGVIAPAGAKVTGATIRMWLLNKFISFLAVLTWKTGLKKM